MNPCLRPACLSDVTIDEFPWKAHEYRDGLMERWNHLERLYNAEWRLRGFERSP
jgi:hypothetical protein